jgi:hypothetical protein
MRIYEVVWMLYAATTLFCIVAVATRFATSPTSSWRQISKFFFYITGVAMVGACLSFLYWVFLILMLGFV